MVVALHGIGGDGKGFASPLVEAADRYGWMVLAPTLAYLDWHDPDQVAREDIQHARQLLATLDGLLPRTDLSLKPKVYVLGFSRGAQLAHRFALFYPERVARVVAFSAGAYTLPDTAMDVGGDGPQIQLAFPFGSGDFAKRIGRPLDRARLTDVQFWIGVGAADNRAGDVPRAWDPYQGRTRLERARTFTDALRRSGVGCSLQVYSGIGHEMTSPLWRQAITFLAEDSRPLNARLN